MSLFHAGAVLLLTVVALSPVAQAQVEAPDRAAMEKAFSEKLSNSVLVGRFTIDGRDNSNLREERYEIKKAVKLEGDDWIVTARIKYGNFDVTVPIKLQVQFAGDTPVMSLTDLTIPGLGAGFTSRTLFYGDRYVGTWQHGEVGGHMFGRVERAAEPESAPEK